MPFEKGKSGNPRGRPKYSRNKVPSDAQIQDSYLKNADKALETLLDIIDDKDAKHSDKYKASAFIAGKVFEIIIERNKSAEGSKQNNNNNNKSSQEKETEAKEPAPMFSLKAVPNNKK